MNITSPFTSCEYSVNLKKKKKVFIHSPASVDQELKEWGQAARKTTLKNPYSSQSPTDRGSVTSHNGAEGGSGGFSNRAREQLEFCWCLSFKYDRNPFPSIFLLEGIGCLVLAQWPIPLLGSVQFWTLSFRIQTLILKTQMRKKEEKCLDCMGARWATHVKGKKYICCKVRSRFHNMIEGLSFSFRK